MFGARHISARRVRWATPLHVRRLAPDRAFAEDAQTHAPLTMFRMSMSDLSDDARCPLCDNSRSQQFHEQVVPAGSGQRRSFRRCDTCSLVFVPRRFHLSRADERAVYEQHENDPADAGYRRFLSRLFEPLRARISDGATGLDFGCGPGPTLSAMFRESGVQCAEYDPFFANDDGVFDARYDFIASSEVFEHLAQPAAVLDRLLAVLKPHGWLGVMTKRVSTPSAFADWHYVRDPTHVSFFSDATFMWIGERFEMTVHIVSADVVLLQSKPY
jgi:hypothetical protein